MKEKISTLKNKIKKNAKTENLVKNISGTLILKGMSLVLSLFTLPVYMNFFNDQLVLGVWFTILSVANWVFTFDVGIGNGLRDCLTRELVKGDKQRIKKYISSAYIMLAVIALIMLGVGLCCSSFINWNMIFNVEESVISRSDLTMVVRIIFIGIMCQFIFKLVAYVFYALQKSAMNNVVAFFVSLIQLLVIVILPSIDTSHNLFNVAIVNAVVANVLYLIATFFAFRDEKLKGCGVSIRYFDKDAAKSTVNIGLLFLWTQILHLLIVLTDDFLVTQFTSPAYEVEYSIYYRLFSLVSTLFSLALTPVWSAVTKAQQEKDYLWLKQIYKLCNKLTGIGIIAEFALIAVLQIIVNLWLGDNAIEINYINAFIFAIYGSVGIVQAVQQTFAYGFGKVKLQCICYSIGVIVKFSIVYFGTAMYPDAWILVVLANILVILPYCLMQPKYIHREIERLK